MSRALVLLPLAAVLAVAPLLFVILLVASGLALGVEVAASIALAGIALALTAHFLRRTVAD